MEESFWRTFREILNNVLASGVEGFGNSNSSAGRHLVRKPNFSPYVDKGDSTPLESPSIYVGDGRNTCKSRSISFLLRTGSKPCPF